MSPKEEETKGNKALGRARRAGKIGYMEPETGETKEIKHFGARSAPENFGIRSPEAGVYKGNKAFRRAKRARKIDIGSLRNQQNLTSGAQVMAQMIDQKRVCD